MIRGPWIRYSLALAVLASQSCPLHAVAQYSSLPANVIAPSAENSVIRNQLTLARKLEQQALQGFLALPRGNSVPIDPVSHQAAANAYVLIRAARHGMGWQKDRKKFQDPTFDLVFKRVDDAWNLARTPVDRPDKGELVLEDMNKAIRLLDQALAMMP